MRTDGRIENLSEQELDAYTEDVYKRQRIGNGPWTPKDLNVCQMIPLLISRSFLMMINKDFFIKMNRTLQRNSISG